jgi:ribulose kinase
MEVKPSLELMTSVRSDHADPKGKFLNHIIKKFDGTILVVFFINLRSPVWRQIIADVLGVELVTVNTAEGGAYGAALLGATGAGQFASVEEACQQVISITGSTAPGKDQEIYQEIYPTYRDLYPALKPIFHR